MQMTALGLAACLAAGLTGACWAQDLKATQRLSDTQIGFDPGGSYGNYTLTIVGPNGFHASAASKTGTPAIDLRRFGKYDDGAYSLPADRFERREGPGADARSTTDAAVIPAIHG